MRIKQKHISFIARKIAIELVNCEFVEVEQGLEPLAKIAEEFLQKDIESELALDEKARELLEKNLEEIEFMRVDERELFWRIKRKLANERGFLLSWDERYGDLSHRIMNALLEAELIDFSVSEIRVKNVIFRAIDSFAKSFNEISGVVEERIKNYKRKIPYGSEEWDLIFEKMFAEELQKRGLN